MIILQMHFRRRKQHEHYRALRSFGCKMYQDQNPRKHSVKRHRMPGYAVEGGNPKENWRHFKKHVELITGPPKCRTEEYKCGYLCLGRSERKDRISTTDSLTSPTMTVRKFLESYKSQSKSCFYQVQFPQSSPRLVKYGRQIHHGITDSSPRLRPKV